MEFNTNHTIATLGLTLFVIGYGVGPLFLAPLSEIPAIGRNPPYVITLAIFVILQPITATVQNIPGFLVLRFLAGFVGSPALATGNVACSCEDCTLCSLLTECFVLQVVLPLETCSHPRLGHMLWDAGV